MADDLTPEKAQAGVDTIAARLEARVRRRDGQRTTVGALADAEPLHPLPAVAFPAELSAARKVSPQGLVTFRGKYYSVPPGMPGAPVSVRLRLGGDVLHIVTAAGAVIAAHVLAPAGAGRLVRDEGHVVALEKAVLSAFTDAGPCRHKTRRRPSDAARAEAARLQGLPVGDPAARVVIDMASYVHAAARLTHSCPSSMDGEEGTTSVENTL